MRYPVDPTQVWMTSEAWLFLIFVCVLLPVAALRQHRRMSGDAAGGGTPDVPRTRLYLSGLFTHAVFLVLVWSTARYFSTSLLASYRPRLPHVAVGLAALTLGLLPLLPRLQLDNPVGRARTKLLAPQTTREVLLFGVVCVSAGVAEELTYRGVLFTLLSVLIGGWWVPAIVSAAIFGVVHLFQGWKSAAIAGLLGLRDQIVVGFTGTLFVAIVVHILHDAVTGAVISLRVGAAEVGGLEPSAESRVPSPGESS